ncbi:MAG TPA: hypothetical protein VNA29_07185 [Sphingomicrobium sp.]|nr:hypothetical protein [Sphingomicrobium sp.]
MKARDDLIFKAEASIRYHKCRAEHFGARNRWISILSIFSGTGVVAGTLAQYPSVALALGIIIAFANAYKLAAKPDQVAGDHEKWSSEWSHLQGEVKGIPQPGDEQMAKWHARVSEINGQCTEDMKVVKNHCWNEAMTSLGPPDIPYTFTLFQRWTKHFLRHAHGFDRQNQAAVKAAAERRAREGAGAGNG